MRIGPNPENAGKTESRGYHAFRRGTVVKVVWGPVEVRRGRRFYWGQTTLQAECRHRTVERAVVCLAARIQSRVEGDGYRRLAAGTRIGRDARSATSTNRGRLRECAAV